MNIMQDLYKRATSYNGHPLSDRPNAYGTLQTRKWLD